MCQEVQFPNNEWVDRIGEIKIKIKHLVFNSSYLPIADSIEDGDCLCCLDLEETAKANGYKCEENEDSMGFKFKKEGE
jgi:uncharacterized protein